MTKNNSRSQLQHCITSYTDWGLHFSFSLLCIYIIATLSLWKILILMILKVQTKVAVFISTIEDIFQYSFRNKGRNDLDFANNGVTYTNTLNSDVFRQMHSMCWYSEAWRPSENRSFRIFGALDITTASRNLFEKPIVFFFYVKRIEPHFNKPTSCSGPLSLVNVY